MTNQTTDRPPSKIDLFPDLTYHFGIGAEELARTPNNILSCYMDALPRLVAGAQLRAIQASSFAKMDEQTQREIMSSLKESQGDHAQAQEPGLQAETIEQAAALAMAAGIGVVIEDPPEKAKAVVEVKPDA